MVSLLVNTGSVVKLDFAETILNTRWIKVVKNTKQLMDEKA